MAPKKKPEGNEAASEASSVNPNPTVSEYNTTHISMRIVQNGVTIIADVHKDEVSRWLNEGWIESN